MTPMESMMTPRESIDTVNGTEKANDFSVITGATGGSHNIEKEGGKQKEGRTT